MGATITGIHLGPDTHANRPAANAAGQPFGALYSCTTHGLIYKTDGSTWTTYATLGGAAVTDATIAVTDVTTNNSGTGQHGWLKKLDNNAAHYMDGTGAWSTPAGGASILLGTNSYGPSTIVLSQTSATQADADATNMKVTFTAPASTNVLVRLTGVVYMASGATAADRAFWGLRESTTNLGGPTYVGYVQATLTANFLESRSVEYLLTGISAGSHTYKWAIAGSGAAQMGVAVFTATPAVMEVLAA